MRYLEVSNRWLSDFQLDGRNIIGRHHYEVFPDIPKRWKQVHRRCLAGASARSEAEQFVRSDGQVQWLRWEVQPWHDNTGGIGGIIIFSEEITDRKMAEQRWLAGLEATIVAIVRTVERRDPYTASHQQRVARLSVAMARQLQMPEQQIEGLRLASTIHDIGKINIPAEILSYPNKLTKLQFELIREHPEAGYEIVSGIDFPWPIGEIIRQHHERLDGSGYPRGLTGRQILPEARILAVADVVESMMSHRPYRAALGVDAALAEVETGKGRHYDPAAVAACLALFRQKGFNLTGSQPEFPHGRSASVSSFQMALPLPRS